MKLTEYWKNIWEILDRHHMWAVLDRDLEKIEMCIAKKEKIERDGHDKGDIVLPGEEV